MVNLEIVIQKKKKFKNALLVNFSFLFEGGKGPGEGGTLQS